MKLFTFHWWPYLKVYIYTGMSFFFPSSDPEASTVLGMDTQFTESEWNTQWFKDNVKDNTHTPQQHFLWIALLMIFPIALPQIITMRNRFSYAYIFIPFFIQILNRIQHHHSGAENDEVVIIHFSFPLTNVYPSWPSCYTCWVRWNVISLLPLPVLYAAWKNL